MWNWLAIYFVHFLRFFVVAAHSPTITDTHIASVCITQHTKFKCQSTKIKFHYKWNTIGQPGKKRTGCRKRVRTKIQAANNSKCHHRSAETSSSNKKKTICCWNAGACGRSVPRTAYLLSRTVTGETDERITNKKPWTNRIRVPKTIYAVLNKWTTMLNMIRVNCMACACFDDLVLQIDFFLCRSTLRIRARNPTCILLHHFFPNSTVPIFCSIFH